MPPNVLAQLARHAGHRPDAAAVVCVGGGGGNLTWAQLSDQVRAASAWVHHHTAPGAVVALAARNRPATLSVFLGVLHAGRTLFPIDAALTDAEVNGLVEQAGIDRILADAPTAARLTGPVTPLRDVRALASADTQPTPGAALLLQSSGTTGGPKIVRRSGPSLDAVARNVAAAIGLTPADRVVAAVPLTHSYGLENALLAPVFAGASMLLHVPEHEGPGQGPQRFAPDTVLSAGATVLPGVPSMFEMILAGPDGCGDLRLAYSAGAPLPAALADALHERDGLSLGTLYGATEIGSVTFAATRSGDGAVGHAMDGVDVRVVDPDHPERDVTPGQPGHLAVHAPSMFDGYLSADAQRLTTGHVLTGDLGRVDPDTGEVFVTGRLKLLIDIGGRKVNPVEVEAAIAEHPDVAECAVLPDPVSPTLSRVKAVVTAAPGRVAPDARTLRAFLKPRLAAHKLPRSVEVRDAMPKSPTGKILRRQLLAPGESKP